MEKDNFKEKMALTDAVEKEEQEAKDMSQLQEVVEGRKIVNTKRYGTIVFDYPSAELMIEGDYLAAKFKSEHLKKGDLLTIEQLKAIYRRPTTIIEDGKETQINNGVWTDAEENRIEELVKEINQHQEFFRAYRSEYQDLENQINQLPKTSKKKMDELQEKRGKAWTEAENINIKIIKLNLEYLNLISKRLELFQSSLEELALFEKIKACAPKCIKKYNESKELVPIWGSQEEFLKDGLKAIEILQMFNIFMRGGNVSFFEDVPEGEISS